MQLFVEGYAGVVQLRNRGNSALWLVPELLAEMEIVFAQRSLASVGSS